MMNAEENTQEIMKLLRRLRNEDAGAFELELQGYSPDWTAPRIEEALRNFFTDNLPDDNPDSIA